MSTTTITPAVGRNLSLQEMVDALKAQRAISHDFVVPASMLRMSDDGTITMTVPFEDDVVTADGVLPSGLHDITFQVGPTAETNLAGRYDIPKNYWNKMAGDALPLRATNLNHWTAQDGRNVLVRTLTDGRTGYMRAALSDRFGLYDSLDAIVAVMEGLAASGVNPDDVRILGGDLTDGRMRLRIEVPGITVDAADLVARYRNPHTFIQGRLQPLVSAGLELGNSETGGGAWTLGARPVFQVCTNGLRRPGDLIRQVHLGGKLDEGVVAWADDTKRAELETLRLKTRDAVAKFLTVGYVQSVVDELRGLGNTEITNPADLIPKVVKAVRLPDSVLDGILNDYIRAGDTTALGVGQAVTSYAQRVADSDVAAQMEEAFFPIVAEAGRLAAV